MARGTFEVTIKPAEPELGGTVSRSSIEKSFSGDLSGSATGVMLSAGDPKAGSAGYVAIETVEGALGGRRGRFCFQQFGTMRDSEPVLYYEVVPGSGEGDLAGLSGVLGLMVEKDGTHRYELSYELED